jgi:FtsP/CotA-like multicopper oxidase with cupredoxin domain
MNVNAASKSEDPRGRRKFLALGGAGTLGAALGLPAMLRGQHDRADGGSADRDDAAMHAHSHGAMGTVSDISAAELSVYDPAAFLTAWNFSHLAESERGGYYRASRLSDGRTLHEYKFVAVDRKIEIAPGVYFDAWTYNGQVPGPTIRATQGDRIRIWFINEGSHPHTIHFHGWHPIPVDGSMPPQFVYPTRGASAGGLEKPFGPWGKDEQENRAAVDYWLEQHARDPVALRQRGLEIYEFDAEPMGLHLYHCHAVPLKRHIHKGLYGAYLVDPAGEGPVENRRPKIDPDTNQPLPGDHPVRELVMVMNGFDTNFDADNEVYAVNSVAFHFMRHPIPVRLGELVRIYLVNLTEFDPINSFHLHASFFRVYRTGTALESQEYTDTVMLCQAERAILEFRLREGWPGRYMFHAHQSEFAELGWMGFFEAAGGGGEVA